MKWRALALGALIAIGCGAKEVPPEQVSRARNTIAPFKRQLVGALTQALAEGPTQAIGVCKIAAPDIAASLSSDGVAIGRTSRRLRNPANAPKEWMEPLLDAYEANPEDADPRAVWVDANTIGYVEPIYVGSMCLACHGESVADSIAVRIDELYPSDQARGFRENDFRGMFWVTMKVKGP